MLWPVLFASTFAISLLLIAFAVVNTLVRVTVFNSALAGKFLERRIDRPTIAFRDCVVLSLIVAILAIF